MITIPFHDQMLSAVLVDNIPHVAMKPICENIGINWDAQKKRINRHHILSRGKVMMTSPSKGGLQEMIMLPLKMLNGWLFGIDVNRVKPEIKEKLIQYQEECFDVLADHFIPKRNALVELPTLTPAQKNHIQKEVKRLVANQIGTTYTGMWSSIKNEFKVGTYKEIPAEQYPDVCEFLKCEPLEGEILPPEKNESYNYPIATIKEMKTNGGNAVCAYHLLTTEEEKRPLSNLLNELKDSGHDIGGASMEYSMLRQILTAHSESTEHIRRIAFETSLVGVLQG